MWIYCENNYKIWSRYTSCTKKVAKIVQFDDTIDFVILLTCSML